MQETLNTFTKIVRQLDPQKRESLSGEITRVANALKEADHLMQCIADAAQKAGIYNGQVALTTPHLKMLLDDMAGSCAPGTQVAVATRLQGPIATGEWLHNFGAGFKDVRCRIVIDMEQGTLLAAQEWTGLKFEDVNEVQLQSLSESVIDVADAHLNPDAVGLIVTRFIPKWAESSISSQTRVDNGE